MAVREAALPVALEEALREALMEECSGPADQPMSRLLRSFTPTDRACARSSKVFP
jgi:hypothetical protein